MCEEEVDLCESQPCHNGGTCTHLSGSYECVCAEGFTGTNCDVTADDSETGGSAWEIVLGIELVLIAVLAIPIVYFLVEEFRITKDKNIQNAV